MIKVSSEISPLQKVIVHRPDPGISRISPKKAEELLFDDIVYLPKMQEEHDIFTQVLKVLIGDENVLEMEDLLFEAIQNNNHLKDEMLDKIIEYEEIPKHYKSYLEELSDDKLARVLISGYLPVKDFFLFDPIPNFIFTRDIAVTVNDHVVITKASKEARERENFLARLVFSAHPVFEKLRKEGRIINMNDIEQFPPNKKGETVSIEGGDMMIINEDYLLVGVSERTTRHGVLSLKDKLFEKKVVKNVVLIHIPADRSYMHIDTIFTQINTTHVVAFGPIIVDGLSSYVEVFRHSGAVSKYHSVKDFWKSELDSKVEFILSGGGESPYQEREQWTDGCNLVSIRPGVALTYDRNPHTEQEFKKFGYAIMHATDFLKKVGDGLDPKSIKNTIITLPSNELSRARGGSHCMTCPILRQ